MEDLNDTLDEVEAAHQLRLARLQMIGTYVVRKLILNGGLDVDDIKYAAMDLCLIEETEEGTIRAFTNTEK
jgi:hypothetical protein